jgi:hypothetical protein
LLFHAQSVIVNILELSIMNATAPFEICISGGGCALAALNYGLFVSLASSRIQLL